MSNLSVVIVDYGLGNLFSVARALTKVGASDTKISYQRSDIERADRLVLPGVGAFKDGMDNLRERDIISTIQEYTRSGRPILGVCLGMQLIMTHSEEFGLHEGLDLIPGNVRHLHLCENERLKIPHIGWDSLNLPGGGTNCPDLWRGTVLDGIEVGSSMYFIHSYVVEPDDPAVPIAVTKYGNDAYCSVFKKDNITGAQFHPELSGEDGLSLYRNFVHGY
jgi:glutamine amidotransferase